MVKLSSGFREYKIVLSTFLGCVLLVIHLHVAFVIDAQLCDLQVSYLLGIQEAFDL